MMLTLTRAAVLVGLVWLLPAWQAVAQSQSAPLSIELNKVEAADGFCRLTFVVTNRTDVPFEQLLADLALFDTDGVIARRMTVDLAPIRAQKTQVVSFPVQDVDCGRISRVLLNEMAACVPPPEEADCTQMVAISHRGPIAFVK